MIRFKAHSDGKVLIPDEAIELRQGCRYTVEVVESNGEAEPVRDAGKKPTAQPLEQADRVPALEAIARMATHLGPPDLSERFDEHTGRVLKDE